jgi:hypothetical protein
VVDGLPFTTGKGHRCTPDVCVCPHCGGPLLWLVNTHRHSCRAMDCFWLEEHPAIQDVETDYL